MVAKNQKTLIVAIVLLILATIGLILGLTLREKPDEQLTQASGSGSGRDAPDLNGVASESGDGGEEGEGEVVVDGDGTDSEEDPMVPLWPHEESDVLPDPKIRFGRLENGFRYMIMPNKVPREEVAIRMHVDVGSFHEEDDQLG